MNSNKYFIAVVLPEPLMHRTEAIKQDILDEHGLKGALRSPSHVTMHRPFEWKADKEEILIEKLGIFNAGETFEIALKGFGAFEPRVVYVNVVDNKALYELHEKLMLFAQRELKLFNELNDKRGFHPHVTVAFRDLKKSKFYEIWPEYRSREFEGQFLCNSISLLKLNKQWEVIKDFKFQKL